MSPDKASSKPAAHNSSTCKPDPACIPLRQIVLLSLCGASGSVYAAPAPAPDPSPEPAPGGTAADFNTSLLFGSDGVDIDRFRYGNPIIPGQYRVDITINGDYFARETLRFIDKGDGGNAQPCLTADLLQRMGVIASPGLADKDGCIFAAQIAPSAGYRFNDSQQKLDLSIPQVALSQQPRGYVDSALWDPGMNAAMLSYNLSSFRSETRDRSDTSTFLSVNAGVNLGNWRLRQFGTASHSNGETRWNTVSAFAQRDLPKLQAQLTLGDTFTTGDLFDSVGFRGARVATDDRMLPQSMRGYAPIIRGVANTQARVEIRQNNNLIYETTVAPGDFQIGDLYSTGYGGDLEVIVTESDGSKRSFKVPYSSVAQLLRPGYNRVSATVGQLRDDSLARDVYIGEATWQRGLNNLMTGYTGAQLSDQSYQAVMVGAAINTPVGAMAIDTTFARARIQQGDGRRDHREGSSSRLTYSNNISRTGTNFSVAAYRYSTSGFVTLNDSARLNDRGWRIQRGQLPSDSWGLDGAEQRQKNRFQININQNLGSTGSLYLSGSTQDYWNRSGSERQYSAGYNRYLGRMNVGVAAARVYLPDGRWDNQYSLNLSTSLGGSSRRSPANLSFRMNKNDSSDLRTQASISGSVGERSQFGYSANAGRSDGGSNDFGVGGSYSGSAGNLAAGYSRSSGGNSSVSVNASGAVVAFPGGVSLAPSLGETFAVIEAKGATGARLGLGTNVTVGRNGYAIVPYLTPYQYTQIALDPTGSSLDYQLKGGSQHVVPTAGAVVKVPFEVDQGRAAVIQARLPDGSPLPFGADVYQDEKVVGVVGQGSRLLARVGSDSGSLRIRWNDSEKSESACVIDYRLPPRQPGQKNAVTPVIDGVCGH